MIKQTLIITTLAALLSVTGVAKGMQGNGNAGMDKGKKVLTNQRQGSQNLQREERLSNYLATIPLAELTEVQKEGLLFMIEEEKVARDVYTYLYEKWSTRVFRNIANSEQQHMNTVEMLLTRYDLEVPTTQETVGSFENEELQALYDMLIAKGELSLTDALEVGVLVEETDISDLEEMIDAGVPEDLEIVYSNLLKGSYNHLNAFNRVLSRQ